MAAPNTYPDTTRARIIELGIDQGQTIRAIHATLEQEGQPAPSLATIAKTLRDHKRDAAPSIEDQPPADILDALTRRSLATIDKYVRAIESTPSRFDPDDMLKIVRTLVEAKTLVQPRKGKQADQPASLLQGLHSVPDTQHTATQTDVATARSLSV